MGEAWAYRTDRRAVGAPVSRVEVARIGSGSKAGSAYVRFFEGEEAGPHEWVREYSLLAPWDQAEVFIRDDRREAAVAAASRVVRGTVEFAAAQLVLGVVRPKGRLRLRGRIADRRGFV